MEVWLFIGLLVILFFLSQQLTKLLSRLLYLFFHHQSVVIHILSFLFLPGVIVHELSHLLMASVLFVPTGEVEFFPEIRGNEVKMGSVAIAQTDPLRRFLIGVAPLVLGLGLLFILFWYFYPIPVFFSWQTALLFYAIFEVSNTMFSSRKDMEGAIGFLIAVGIIALFIFLLGFRIPVSVFSVFTQDPLRTLFFGLDIFLFVSLFLDVVVVGICTVLLRRT